MLGSAAQIIVPVFDQYFEGTPSLTLNKQEYNSPPPRPSGYNKIEKEKLTTVEEYTKFIVDCFDSATERDIYTGDKLEIVVLRKNQEPQVSYYNLRKD